MNSVLVKNEEVNVWEDVGEMSVDDLAYACLGHLFP